MTKVLWGLLGPGELGDSRRTRTLGLGRAVRSFNELAVPGLGGVWFGKQLFLATLGIWVAQEVRALRKQVTNIEIANAIEALACWYGLRSNVQPVADPRLRGSRKLANKDDVAFVKVRTSGFYVTQPMRMSVGQALPSLGLVDAGGSRFNTFVCIAAGEALIGAHTKSHNPCYYSSDVVRHLVDWVTGDVQQPAAKLGTALSPLEALSTDAKAVISERLNLGGVHESVQETERRRAVLAWVETLRTQGLSEFSWSRTPKEIESSGHWQDLQAGASFFQTRDAALAALDSLELHISQLSTGACHNLLGEMPIGVSVKLEQLRAAAARYLEIYQQAEPDPLRLQHADAMADAAQFCDECVAKNDSDILRRMVERDGRVFHLKGSDVVPGPAFSGGRRAQAHEVSDGEEAGTGKEVDNTAVSSRPAVQWPDGISHRVRNMFLLNADLRGQLDDWLEVAPVNGEDL